MVFYFYQLDSEVGGNGQTKLSKHLFPVNLAVVVFVRDMTWGKY